jgi:VanZ family protein
MTGSVGWRLAAAAWAIVIIATGVLPTSSTVATVSGGHDSMFTAAAHFAAYAVLGFVLGLAVSGWTPDARGVLVVLALAAVLGGAIEVIQGPLSYRDAQLADFLVDVAGAAVGLAALSAVARGRRSRSRPG